MSNYGNYKGAMKQDIEQFMEQNKVIGKAMGVEPEIEYCVGNDGGSCFHPKHCGTTWPPKQKHECEKWLSNSKWAKDQGYEVKKEEWWPWYNQDWNKLMEAVEKIEAMGYFVSINGNACAIMKDRFGGSVLCSACNWENKQQSVYQAVHGFCQWQLTQIPPLPKE